MPHKPTDYSPPTRPNQPIPSPKQAPFAKPVPLSHLSQLSKPSRTAPNPVAPSYTSLGSLLPNNHQAPLANYLKPISSPPHPLPKPQTDSTKPQ
ncbi:hypothetical protein BDY21DRAFT_333261 [Lineolata rhizophorae]|uniref:Uncharacterized protein n=1 Tax=Lineolata rhizophorae TaxID=578093 RepID=A0A6A6PA10_9PEZI|nr:hypothetical protein BDY21DRAFT_333261 [Lineolata rhizophorae]